MSSDRLNPHVAGRPVSATLAINELSNELRSQGRRVFKLGLGQSPFPVPTPVVEALRANAHQKDYLPVRGLAELRAAVASYHARRGDADRSAADVLVGPGCKELMFQLQMAYTGELTVPTPSWVSYAPQAALMGRTTRRVPTRRDAGWRLSAETLDEVCSSSAERARLLIINYPNNPVGNSYDAAQLEALADVARRHRMVVLSDELYGELEYRGEHVSIARFYPEGTIIASGLSKWCGAGGWRLGTFLFPPELRWLSDAVATIASESFTSTSAPIQYAAVAAFQPDPELDDYLGRSRRVLAGLASWVATRLRAAGVHCAQPEGGFYVLVDASELADRLGRRGVTGSRDLCTTLLEETGVAALPGRAFGFEPEALTMRVAFVDFDGAAALAAIGDEAPDEAFLRAHCAAVLEAVDIMCDWLSS